jgi:hypothetical protein
MRSSSLDAVVTLLPSLPAPSWFGLKRFRRGSGLYGLYPELRLRYGYAPVVFNAAGTVELAAVEGVMRIGMNCRHQ